MMLFECLIVVGFCIIGAHLLMLKKLRKCSEELTGLKNDVLVVREYYVSVIQSIANLSSRKDEAIKRIDDIEKVINCPLINHKHKQE